MSAAAGWARRAMSAASGKNEILNRYYMSKINYFKVLLLCEIMW
jgi:hypothetical protein